MSDVGLQVRHLYEDTHDGWSLHLRRSVVPSRLRSDTDPLLIVPGYGMNSFIFSYHPRDTSMERCLAEAGYEVWAVDLRGQGESRKRDAKSGAISMSRYATVDVPTALKRVLTSTTTSASQATLIGVSLGGSIVYSHLALAGTHGVGRMVAMGAPLRWTNMHPLLRLAFSSRRVAGAVRMSRTRELVGSTLPILQRIPPLLGLYMNSATIDMDRMPEMIQTVEDPEPHVNREIAQWIRQRDLHIEGINVSEALRTIQMPLKVILANRDGIVPPATASSVLDYWGGSDTELLTVGDKENWFAHANLFIANDSPQRVFDPLIDWLGRKG